MQDIAREQLRDNEQRDKPTPRQQAEGEVVPQSNEGEHQEHGEGDILGPSKRYVDVTELPFRAVLAWAVRQLCSPDDP